jgi:hypothetical protein
MLNKQISNRNTSYILRSEWMKLSSLLSTKIYIIATFVLGLFMSFLFLATLETTNGRAITDLVPLEVLSAAILGMDVATVIFVIFAAVSVASEYTTGTINISLAVVPHRAKLFFSKGTVLVLLSFVSSITRFLSFSSI